MQGGLADTIIADMVHAAAAFDPRFQNLLKNLVANFSDEEIALARRRYEQDFKGKFSGSNFATFESFLNTFWAEGAVQHLLLPENSEIGEIRKQNPKAGPVLDNIKLLFEGKLNNG